MDERFRDALRRNALLDEILSDDGPRELGLFRRELAGVRRRRFAARAGMAAAAGLIAAAFWRPAPAPLPVPERPVAAPAFQVVRTADVAASLEVVRTGAAALEIVRTEGVELELAGDTELLGTSRTAALVGPPGGPRRLLLAP